MMTCVSTVSYSILLNSQEHGFIKPERGIRKRDPLSPFLFILCTEALVNVLNVAEKKGKLHGIKLSPSGPAVHNLLFADNSLLMCRADVAESSTLVECLQQYSEASGQEINKMKSSIIFGAKIPLPTRNEIKRILEIDKEGGDGSYLGLPECFQGSKKDLLNFIRERLHGRLNGWFARALSQGGKEILLKSIALALPVYAMSVFKLPKDLCDKLTSVMTELWWSSGNNRRNISWIAWQRLCRRKDEGGLGFHDISGFNQALLAKQAWRILQNPHSLVARVLQSKYWKNGSFMDCGLGSRPSFAWRSILHGRELIKKGMVRKLGDGRMTKVWTNNWIIDLLPRPPMYLPDAVIDLSMTVDELLIPHTGLWDVHKGRQRFVEKDAILILKLKTIQYRQDSLQWGFTKDGTYTSRSGYGFRTPFVPPKSQRLVGPLL